VAFNLALPIALLFILYKIYVKLKSTEAHLKAKLNKILIDAPSGNIEADYP